MSESITTYKSSRTIATPAGTEESLEMDPVSVTQPYFFSDEGQEAQGYDTVILDDGGRVSSDLDLDTSDKIPRRHASLYASLALIPLFVIGMVIQEDLEWLYKQPLSTTFMNEALWPANLNKVQRIKPLPIKPKENGLAPVQPLPTEDEPTALSPSELSAENSVGLDIAPSKHTILD